MAKNYIVLLEIKRQKLYSNIVILFTMSKKVISLRLKQETIKKMDKCSLVRGGNRSAFVEWLALNDFFIPKALLEKTEAIARDLEKLKVIQK